MIIGFTGQMGAGKTTAAKPLEALGFTKVSFAEPLKAQALNIVNRARFRVGLPMLSRSDLDADKDRWRTFLQGLGNIHRDFVSPTYWVDQAVAQLVPGKDYYLDDVRFLNEAEAIRKAGGVIVRVTAPDVVRAERLGISLEDLKAKSLHPSEVEQMVIEDDAMLDGAIDRLTMGRVFLQMLPQLRAIAEEREADLRRIAA